MSFCYRVVNIGVFWVNAGPRGRPYGDITCSTLKMDITIEYLVIKIPRVSMFSYLCRFVTELLTLTTFGSMPGSWIWPYGVFTSSNLKMNVTVRFLVQHLPKVPFFIIPYYIVSGICAHKQFWANWGACDVIMSQISKWFHQSKDNSMTQRWYKFHCLTPISTKLLSILIFWYFWSRGHCDVMRGSN